MSNGEQLVQVVLDKSGSMAGIVDDTLKGLNHFISEHRTNVPNARFSLTLFDTTFNLLWADMPMSEVPDVTRKEYQAGGGTALLDAVGATIRAIENLGDRFDKVTFVIITDGEENSSRDFTYEAVKDLIDWHTSEGKGWAFTFLGANIDSFAHGAKLGVRQGSTANFNATPAGMRAMYAGATGQSISYNTGTADSLDYDEQTRATIENTK